MKLDVAAICGYSIWVSVHMLTCLFFYIYEYIFTVKM